MKAEQRVLEAYPPKYAKQERFPKRIRSEKTDTHSTARAIYLKGYNQAEKDLELTYDDICEIMEIREDVLEMDSYENLYEEILKRFKNKQHDRNKDY